MKAVSRQSSSPVGRADLVFEHPRGYRIVVEVKAGVAPRGVGEQLHDYWGAEKAARPNIPVEMMVVANEIPRERRLYLENRNIEAREIPVKRFREVASTVGYRFESEEILARRSVSDAPSGTSSVGQLVNSISKPAIAEPSTEGSPALFASLEAANLKAVFDSFRRSRSADLLIGTDCNLRRAKELQIRRVYFKAIGPT